MKTKLLLTAFVSSFIIHSSSFAQGSLTPPGAPAPTMKSLAQVEPRTPVQTLAGDVGNLYIISQPGSYYLTTNLIGAGLKAGISIQADNVTLDLNGFAVIGTTLAAKGIVVSGTHANITVRNGTVRDWSNNGVDLSTVTGVLVTDLMVTGNNGIGISVGDASLVSSCISRQNTNDNIRAGSHCVVTKCSALSSMTGSGISMTGGFSVISQCTVNNNNQNGIHAYQRCRVSDCVACFNSQSGIHLTIVGTVEHCVCDNNAICGILNDNGGLSDILNNNCSENGAGNSGAGIRVSNAGGNRIEGNNVVQNFRGIDVLSTRNIIGHNTAAANVNADYIFVAGNSTGPVVNVASVGDISGTANANHPFANLRY